MASPSLASLRSLDLIFYRLKPEEGEPKWSQIGLVLHQSIIDPRITDPGWIVAQSNPNATGYGIELCDLSRMLATFPGDMSIGYVRLNPYQPMPGETSHQHTRRCEKLTGDLRLILYRYISSKCSTWTLMDYIMDRLTQGIHISTADFVTRVFQCLGIIPLGTKSYAVQITDLINGNPMHGIPSDFIHRTRQIKVHNGAKRARSCMASVCNQTLEPSFGNIKRRTQRRSLPNPSPTRQRSPIRPSSRQIRSTSDLS